jgi:hypothetical protein
MITAIDTNVLLDIMLGHPAHQEASALALAQATADGALIIGEVVYAELAAALERQEALDGMLEELGVSSVPLGFTGAFEAGQIHTRYRRSGGRRERVLADFFVAAHALQHADRLLTRDRGYYRQCFPSLVVMEP